MPIARGIMQVGRINVFPTTTTLVSINPPDSGFCGDLITFKVKVSNNRGVGFPLPTGTVLIKDSNTNTTLASGSLSPSVPDGYSKVDISSTISISNNQIYAQYVGVVNQFGASQSSPTVPYSVSLIGTNITITNTPGTNFCFHNNFNLNVHVARSIGGAAVTTGNVQVNLYTDPISFTTIGSATLNGSGNATVVLPANTTVPGNNYYIQATYLGSGCFGTSNSPIGVNGTLIHSVSLTQNTTTTAVTSGSGSFCINSSRTFTATVNSAFLGGPGVGSVTFTAFKSPTTITLGTDSSVVGGVASINVLGGTFPSTGTWTVTAAYTGDGYCFANSTSVGVSAVPSKFTVDMVITQGNEVFCYAVAQTFKYNISSTFSGIINGTFVLKSSNGITLASVTTSGSSAGFVITFNVPAFTTADGAQNLFVQFTPVSNSCYNSGTSGDFPVIITSFLSQTPDSTTLDISPASGTFFTVFNFTITVFKGSGTGPLDGAGALNGSGTIFIHDFNTGYFTLNNNVHIFDYGTYGSGSYSTSGFAISTDGAIGRWNGNRCYSFQDSLFVPMDVSSIIH